MARQISFKPARRKSGKLRLAITGPAGSGKTMGALRIAAGLGGKVALLDTEGGSSELYEDVTPFDCFTLAPPFDPSDFSEAIMAAEEAGYDTLIIDSLSHEWEAIQNVVERMRQNSRDNSLLAWGRVMPQHKAVINRLLNAKLNIIATMRVKTAYVEGVDEKGKKRLMPQTLKLDQKDGIDYEFTVVFDLDRDNTAMATKDRTRLFGNERFIIDENVGRQLAEWLDMVPVKTTRMTPLRQEFYELMAKRHHGNARASLAELSSFFGRTIKSGPELTDEELRVWLAAVRENGAAEAE